MANLRISVFVVILASALPGCNIWKELSRESVIVSNDNLVSITIPGGWMKQKNLNEVANLQASSILQDLYTIGISEAKADFDKMTLKRYSRLTRTSIAEKLGKAESKFLKKFTVNGMPATQYRIAGVLEGINLVYLHTALEGENHFHYLLSWSVKSRFEKGEPTLQKIITSFKEVKKAPEPQATE